MVTFAGVRLANGSIVPLTGEPVIHKFDFSHSTAGLNNGVNIYVPTPGDILLDAWIEIDTAFDGITPMIDLSQFIGGTVGWFLRSGPSPIDATVADRFSLDTAGVKSSAGSAVSTHSGPTPATPIGPVALSSALNLTIQAAAGAFSELDVNRLVPAVFTSSNPVKLVLSQDGSKGGASSAPTVGSGTVFLYVGTPV